MDLSVFTDAENAVKRLTKDYKPVMDLAETLERVKIVLAEVGELEGARERAVVALAETTAAKVKAEGLLASVQAEVKQAEGILARVKATLSGIKL